MRMMTTNLRDITEWTRRFVTDNCLLGQNCEFGDSDSFLEHGIVDSTGVLELVAFLQETYGIVVEDEELIPENLDSLANIAAYVSHKLNPAEPVPSVDLAPLAGDNA
jgi:acyl carrier protein